MNAAISRRRCALLLGSAGLVALASGCSSVFGRKPREAEITGANIVQTTPDPIHIIYRTRTDRLNLAGAHLPHCSIAELSIQYPHPTIKAAICQATVRSTPCSVDATPFPERGVTAGVASMFGGESTNSAPATLVGVSDMELWEVEAIIVSLEKLHFFHKQRTVLSADAFLSVKTAKYAVGKKYRPVAELDAMLLRVAQHQSAAAPASYPATARAELTRLPTF